MAPRHLRPSTIARPLGTLTLGVLVALGAGGYLVTREPLAVFDQRQLASGVATVLSAAPPTGYGLGGVTGVGCPSNVTVEAGTVFRCSLQLGGSGKSVTVIVTGDARTAAAGGLPSGVYEVTSPS
jgi:hypothetical protein